MFDLVLLEIIAISAFLYSLFIVFFYMPSPEQYILFLWTVAVSAFFGALSRKKRIFDLGFVLLLLPLWVYRDGVSAPFVTFVALIMYTYAKRSLLKGSHHEYARNFKWALVLYFVVIYVHSLLEALAGGSPGQASPFIVLYLFASVMLIRSIRHLDSSLGAGKIRKDNLRYTAMMLGVFIISTFEQVRDLVRTFGHRFINLVALPFYYIAKVVEFLVSFISRDGTEPPEMGHIKPPPVRPGEIDDIIRGDYELINIAIADKLLVVIFFAILLFILYRIIIKSGVRETGIEYTEVREYISERPVKKRARRDNYPSQPQEQIRYYYRRFLDKIRSYKISLADAFTTQDINQRVEFAFGDEIEGIRDIYIQSRYGEKPVTANDVENMKFLYKKLS